MKEKLIQMLIEARAKRAEYITKYNNAVFDGKWEALADAEEARIKEIEKQLESFGDNK